MDLKTPKHIHMVGIGGIGMSGLARYLKGKGHFITGSDQSQQALLDELRKEGMEIHLGHSVENLEKPDYLIYSEAIPEENPERQRAEELGLSQMNYFEALGEVTKDYFLIAIAGTHGKTTTTALLGLILTDAGLDPTVLVGSKVKQFNGSNLRLGKSKIFVVEACEYRENFLSLHPKLLGITNMEWDHFDHFKTEESYRAAFETLAKKSQEVIWPDGYEAYSGELSIPGEHNLYNAGLAAACARHFNVSEEQISQSLKNFQGTWRRFDEVEPFQGARIILDYAHHPTEISATLLAAKSLNPKRIIAVFQPHQFSRTRQLLNEFCKALSPADLVYIPNIYESRDSEEEKHAVSAEDLIERMNNAVYSEGLEKTAQRLKTDLQEGDLLLIMGAGDVYKINELLRN